MTPTQRSSRQRELCMLRASEEAGRVGKYHAEDLGLYLKSNGTLLKSCRQGSGTNQICVLKDDTTTA